MRRQGEGSLEGDLQEYEKDGLQTIRTVRTAEPILDRHQGGRDGQGGHPLPRALPQAENLAGQLIGRGTFGWSGSRRRGPFSNRPIQV